MTREEKIDALIHYWWEAMTEKDLFAYFQSHEKESYLVLDDAKIDEYYADLFDEGEDQ